MAAFLKNIFAPKWQHKDSNVRLQALDQLSDTSIIENLAKQDPNEAVRIKAIHLVKNLDFLASLFNEKSSPIKQAAITQYLKTVLNTDEPQAQLAALHRVENPQHLMTIATYAGDADLAQGAINQIKDEATLFDFIKQSASAKSRLLAAQYIKTKDTLKAIEQLFLNKDKTLVRHVKEKLSALAEQEAIKQKAQAQIDQLLSSAQQLTKHAFSPTYAGQIALLKQSWENVESSPQQNTSFQQDIAQCEKVLAEHQQQQMEIEKAQAAQKQAQELQLTAIQLLQNLHAQCKSSPATLDEINNTINSANQSWTKANELNNKIDKQLKNEFESLLKPIVNLQASLSFLNNTSIDLEPVTIALKNHALNELKQQQKAISATLKSINWPEEFPKSSTLNSVITLKNEIKSALDALLKDEKQVINNIHKALSHFEQAINNGHLKEAKQLQTSIRRHLEQADSKNTKSLQTQFQSLSQTLNELKDWQGFATLPKFEKLCNDMNLLIDADIAPKDKAVMIRELQDEWKTLGSLADQKQQQALWLKFKQASDLAYVPCQAYFEEMGKVRAYNLSQRTIICEQLEQFFNINDWDNANWKSVQQILDKAHDEFKSFSPVDHTEKKAIMQRFHEATQALHGKLVEHFKQNAAAKQLLIDEVKALHEQEDIAQAIEQCKLIQTQWKDKGNAGRAERQLWANFREQCDRLFEKRKSASQARKQFFDDNIAQANALLEKAKQVVANASADAKTQLNDFADELNEIELPSKVKQAITKNLNDLQAQLHNAIKQQKRQAQHSLWMNAQQLAQSLGQAEQQGQVDNAALNDHLESCELPAQVKAILQTRLNNNQTNNNDTLEKLCLELEIVLEVESPASEQAARMALQVERLQKNMGQSLPSIEAQLEDLQCRWFAIKVENADYDSLHQRFFTTLNNQVEQA